MYAAILDSNVLRGLNDTSFDRLLDAEKAIGIVPLLDSWTLIELFAHLADPNDTAYQICRRAVSKAARRSLLGPDPVVVFPAEAEVARLLFQADPPSIVSTISELIETARYIRDACDTDDLQRITPTLQQVADHVASKEKWFADFARSILTQVNALTPSGALNGPDSRAQVRTLLRSSEALRLDAAALAGRAYKEMGITIPDVFPQDHLDAIMAACRAGSTATALVLETVICDGANLDKSRIRNLLWDQEVAFQLGQTIAGMPVLLVTDDSFFKRAASAAGFDTSVRNKSEYWMDLGL